MENKTNNQNNKPKNKWLLRRFRNDAIIKKLKISLGLVCLGIAVFPNGLGVIFYTPAFLLLGISFKDIADYKRILKCKLRGWL